LVVASCFVLDSLAQTPAQYAQQKLIEVRLQVVRSLPNYTTLIKMFDVLIEAVQAELDPAGEKFQTSL
jgi:hypothetical protein